MSKRVNASGNISVIVLSKNNADTLEPCLKSVVNALPYDKEVIVVDAKSTDNTSKILEKLKDKIRVVYDDSKGRASARELGVKTAKWDIVAFVDSDVICSKEHFLRYIDYFNKHPEVTGIDSYGTHPILGTGWQKDEALFLRVAEKNSEQRPTLAGWCMAFRKNALLAIGGFYTRVDGSEEGYVSYMLRIKGFKIVSNAVQTSSVHVPRRDVGSFIREMMSWGKNGSCFFNDFYSLPLLSEDMNKHKIFRLIRNVKVFTIVTYAMAPVSGLKYIAKTRKIKVYLHYLIRQYSWLAGYAIG